MKSYYVLNDIECKEVKADLVEVTEDNNNLYLWADSDKTTPVAIFNNWTAVVGSAGDFEDEHN